MTKELWEQVENSNYYISNLGRLISTYNKNTSHKKLETILCNGIKITGFERTGRLNMHTKRHSGYLILSLSNCRKKQYYIHRLVATYFIKNPNNLPCINHRDGNHLNNKVTNLEWCTYSYNNKHSYKTGLKVGRKGDKVFCYSLKTGLLIDSYSSMREAERVNKMANGSISMAIKKGWNYNNKFWSRNGQLSSDYIINKS